MHIPLGEYRRLLATYLAPQARRVTVLALLLIASIGLQLVNPQILRFFIDTVTSKGEYDTLARAAVLFIAIAFLQRLIVIGATYLSEITGWTATNALRADLAYHLLKLDMSFHKTRTPGEMIERVDGDVTLLANFFSQFIIQVLGNILLLVGVLAVLWIEDWRAGLVLTIYAAIVLAAMARIRAVAVPYWRAFREASADLYGFLEERLAGTADIRSSGAQQYVMRRLYMAMRHRLITGKQARLRSTIPWSLPIIFYAFGNILAFSLATYFYYSGAVMLGTAFLLYSYIQIMIRPLNQITNQIDDFQKASAGIARVDELMHITGTLAEGGGVQLHSGALAVEFKDVTFSYEESTPVITDLSFRIEKGEVLGLLGRTGSGKTTISRLLFRLYDPDRGAILLDGKDIRDFTFADLRYRVGMVTQEVQLFNATIRDSTLR